MAKAIRNLHFMNGTEPDNASGDATSLRENATSHHRKDTVERPGMVIESWAGTDHGGMLPVGTDTTDRLAHLESYFDEDSIHHKFDMYNLSRRENELTLLVLKGYSNRDIAESLYISEQTVKDHLHNIFRKVEIKRRSELAARVLGLKRDFS